MKTRLSALSLRGLAAGVAALLLAGAGAATAAPAHAASPSIDMPYPVPVSDLADGIPVTVNTDPNAEVDVKQISGMLRGPSITLPIKDVDRFDGKADASGKYTFTLKPSDEFIDTFKPERSTTLGKFEPNDALIVQLSTAKKNTSKVTVVTYDAGQIDGPETATVAEAKAGMEFSVKDGPAEGYSYAPSAALGDKPIDEVAPAKVGPEEKFTVTAPDSVAVGDEITVSVETNKDSNQQPDMLPVKAHTVRIVEEPTEDPTEVPTDDPTEVPTDDPTQKPTDDPSTPAERTLTVDPERISPADFVKDGAVTITATGCEPGSEAKLTVTPKNDTIGTHVDTAKAGDDGAVSFSVFGDNPAAVKSYIGDYDVVVSCAGGDDLTGSFTVGEGGKDDGGKGGNDKDKDDGKPGDRLPRTGAELTAAGAGLALLAVGAAGVMLTRRRS